MTALAEIPDVPQRDQAVVPAAPVLDFGAHLPQEDHLSRIVVGVVIGVPVATVVGASLVWFSLAGTGAESHAWVLALPFGGMFGILGGAIGGLMATMRH